MTAAYAADIITWRYPEHHTCYNLVGAEPAYFLNPANGFYALVDEDGALPGRRSIVTALAFGRQRFRPPAFWITVADFNTRARHVVESLGFKILVPEERD